MKSKHQQQAVEPSSVQNHSDNPQLLDTDNDLKDGPGALLKAARIAKGLSVEEVAAKLNLRPGNVINLEAERFDEKISVTFTRGYLKLYAKLVGLPPDTVLAAFDALKAARQEPAKLQSFSRRVARETSDNRLMLVSYLILTIILALVFLWWWQQSESSMPAEQVPPLSGPQTLPAPTFSPAVSEDNVAVTEEPSAEEAMPSEGALTEESANNQAQAEGYAGGDLVDADQASSQLPAQVAAVAAADLAPPNTEAAAAAGGQSRQGAGAPGKEVEMIFEFAGDCWINITDATGEAIAYGVKAAGRIMPVTGLPPFEVVLGAPEVVQISYNGQPVDMSVFKSGQTARFTLPMSR